jgi:hypothetical protein
MSTSDKPDLLSPAVLRPFKLLSAPKRGSGASGPAPDLASFCLSNPVPNVSQFARLWDDLAADPISERDRQLYASAPPELRTRLLEREERAFKQLYNESIAAYAAYEARNQNIRSAFIAGMREANQYTTAHSERPDTQAS